MAGTELIGASFVAAAIVAHLTLSIHGRTYDVTLVSDADPCVTVQTSGKTIWTGIKRDWQPWKLAVADIDGTGCNCFVVGLNKSTRYLPQRHHTLFVYRVIGFEAIPKWRGSTIGRNFDDFEFAPAERPKLPQRLVTVDRLLDGRRCIACYVWKSFGFSKVWEFGSWKTLSLVSVSSRSVAVVADGRRVALPLGGS